MSIGIGLSIGASSGGGGGSVNTGVLQISGGAPLSGTLQTVVDQSNNSSLLRLSTTQLAFAGFATAPTADIVWRTNPTLTDYTGWHQTDGTFRILTKNNASLFINIASSILFSNGLSAQSIMSSNGALGLGIASTPSARLHVTGDGTNNVARFENSGGTNSISINSAGNQITGTGILGSATLSWANSDRILFTSGIGGASATSFLFQNSSNFTATNGVPTLVQLNSTFSSASVGTSTPRVLNIEYTANYTNTQSGTLTGIRLNATETALNGMGHNLIDLQRGGVSQFLVDRIGIVTAQAFIGTSYIRGRLLSTSGIQLLEDTAGGTFNRLQFGGTTNAFPAIKRNGAAIDFRLADDSGFCDVFMKTLYAVATVTGFTTAQSLRTPNSVFSMYGNGQSILWDSTQAGDTNIASSLLTLNSTSRGFLPPRMTTTQVNAIVTPAEGLVVYNTTISHLCVYQAGAWVKLSHSPM